MWCTNTASQLSRCSGYIWQPGVRILASDLEIVGHFFFLSLCFLLALAEAAITSV
jgi:hypothetical protein